MILDLHYSNFSHATLENIIEKLYNKYLIESDCEKVQKKKESDSGGDKTVKVQENGKQSATTSRRVPPKIERRSESYPRNAQPRTPTKTSPPSRKSEPISYRSSQPPQKSSSPQKKTSPKEIRNRVRSATQERNQPPVSSMSPKALFKVEKGLDKLKIEVAKPSQQRQVQNNGDENILRQQNSSENSSPVNTLKPKVAPDNKVYFREENSENLSWNGETSFEDDPEAIESPRVNQYSSSFLNFLSNN